MERNLHFARHGAEFGARDEMHYEQMADSFMFGQITVGVTQCVRPNNTDRLRFNDANKHFGVACTGPIFLRTYFLVGAAKIAKHHGGPGFFAYECARTTL